jgi:hypothetical protein
LRKKYYAQQKDKILARNKKYRDSKKDFFKIYNKEYRRVNKEKLNEQSRLYKKNKYHNDIQYRLKSNLRRRILRAMHKNTKSKSTLDLVGCSIEYLRKYLESKFKSGMSWNNYGHKGWHIDHIRPCKSFDLSLESEQKICFHYTNLQPLWWFDNLEKGDSI